VVLVGYPEAGAGEVELDVEAHGHVLIMAESEPALVIGPHQIRIALFVGFDWRGLPGAAFAAWFTEFPEVVDGSSPQGGLAVVTTENVVAGFGVGFRRSQ
jgi:hypothetical protein